MRRSSKFLRDLWSHIKGCIKKFARPAAKTLIEQIWPIFLRVVIEQVLRHYL
jgi:hypothetical protein